MGLNESWILYKHHTFVKRSSEFSTGLQINKHAVKLLSMISSINHLYHEGWDCICSARSTSLDYFRAVVNCRSLIGEEIRNLPESTVDFANEIQAIELAIQMALGWTQKTGSLQKSFKLNIP
jgi:hypothetical protein